MEAIELRSMTPSWNGLVDQDPEHFANLTLNIFSCIKRTLNQITPLNYCKLLELLDGEDLGIILKLPVHGDNFSTSLDRLGFNFGTISRI